MDNCKGCGKKNTNMVSLAFAEMQNAANERTVKRLWIIIIILAAIILVQTIIIAGLIKRDSEYEDVVTTIEAEQEADGNGRNYVIGGDVIGDETESPSDG